MIKQAAIDNKPILVSKESSVYFSDILVLQHKFCALQKKKQVACVAIYDLGYINTAKLIVALDSMVETVILIPGDVNETVCHKLCVDNNIDLVIHSGSIKLHHLVDITIEQLYQQDDEEPDKKSSIETCWVLMTSGTTGSPKLVSHTMYSLTNTVKKSSKFPSGIWGLFYSPYRFAGMQVLLQSIITGNELVVSEYCNSLKDTLKLFADKHVNFVSATPTIWRKVLMTEYAELLSLDVITLGGEIVDQNILNALKKQYPKARLIHIYASTEAGSGFSVSDGFSGFPKAYFNNEQLPFNIDISSQSTLLIKSSSQAKGYLGNSSFPIDENGYIDTGDVIELIGDRGFFKGRENGSINVGGLKVHPEEVESVLLSHPKVKLASVSAKKNPITGAIVTAQLVIISQELSNKEMIKEIKAYCRERLEAYKVPALMKIIDDISINSTGKTVR